MIDAHLLASNVLPEALLKVKAIGSPLASRDLIALSSGHDFLLQASNDMCADAAFSSLNIPWVAGTLDAQAVAALRAGGASFTSTSLRQAVSAPLSAMGDGDVLLLFSALDVLFDSADQCRVRANVKLALGSLLVVPKEPGLVHGLAPGEAVEQIADPVSRVTRAVLAAVTALTPQPLTLRTLASVSPSSINASFASERDRAAAIWEGERHIDLGNRASFQVSAWLGNGVVEIAAPFAAAGDKLPATIHVGADVSQSNAHFTELSHDASLLLSDADPLGLVQTTTQRVRQRSSVALLEDVSLVGGPANASVGHLDAMAVEAFPCGTGACALNVGATIIPGRVALRTAIAFIGSSRYGVVWSADAVKLLVRFAWETGGFPRSITQTSTVRLVIEGVEQDADAISIFHLDTLDIIELEYDANGRSDLLYTQGTARVVPQFIRLKDGRELIAKDAHDPVFAPSDPRTWTALGDLTEQPLSTSLPELLWFERAVTRGVTSRLGRPFTDPPDAVVTDSRLSAPAQRIALLVS